MSYAASIRALRSGRNWTQADLARQIGAGITRAPMDCFARAIKALAATIGELARRMIDVHIHRVIVVDQSGKPIGIVSSTDVLAALAQADQARSLAEH